jgi:hypothetical protein
VTEQDPYNKEHIDDLVDTVRYMRMTLEDIVPGRSTGLRDMDGNELFDGDIVENLNIPEEYEMERIGPIRLAHLLQYTFWTAASASIQGFSHNKNYGVRKIEK